MFLLPPIGGRGNAMPVEDANATWRLAWQKQAVHSPVHLGVGGPLGGKGQSECTVHISAHTCTSWLRIAEAKDPNHWWVFWALDEAQGEPGTTFRRCRASYTFQKRVNKYVCKDFKRKDTLSASEVTETLVKLKLGDSQSLYIRGMTRIYFRAGRR